MREFFDKEDKEEWELVALGDNEGPFKDDYWKLMRPRLITAIAMIESQVEMELEETEIWLRRHWRRV